MSENKVNGGYASHEEYINYHREYYNKNKERIALRKKNDPWNDKLRHAKIRADEAGLPFDIDRDYLDSIKVTYCPALGLVLKYTENSRIQDDSATIDRIIPELGYVKGNVQILSYKANRMKSNATSDELAAFANWILRNHT
jgi:hypothetical protein